MSDPLTHIVVSDVLGQALGSIKDKNKNIDERLLMTLAFIGGASSHALLDLIDEDYTPNWQEYKRNAEALKKDMPHIALQVTGLAKQIYDLFQEEDKTKFKIRLASILGYVSTELVDIVYSLVNPEAWRKGQLLMPWHDYRGPKQMQTREEAIRRGAFINLAQWTFRF
jgi:hypothetical protein